MLRGLRQDPRYVGADHQSALVFERTAIAQMARLRQMSAVAMRAKGCNAFVFWRDEVGDGRMVGVMAGEAGDGRGALAKSEVRVRHRTSLDGITMLVSLVEVQVKPGILCRNRSKERQVRALSFSEVVRLAHSVGAGGSEH